MTCDAPASSQRRALSEVHAAAELHSAGEGRERAPRFGIVVRSQHDDVAAAQAVAFVEVRVPGGGMFRDKVRLQPSGRLRCQRATDDLFYLSLMEVYARTKHNVNLKLVHLSSKCKMGAAARQRP